MADPDWVMVLYLSMQMLKCYCGRAIPTARPKTSQNKNLYTCRDEYDYTPQG